MKKIALLTVAVLALGAVVVPASASALTANEILQALSADPALLSQLQALLGGTATTGGTSSAGSLAAVQALTKDLTIGSKGADVTALQTWLVEEGYMVMPVGVPMGYFGTLTQKALAQWQAENAVTPAAGYFGPKTRGVIATLSSTGTGTGTLPAGCTSTAGYSSTTGAKCDGSTTGSTGGTISTPGVEGTLSVSTNPTPSSGKTVHAGDTNVDVLGLKLEAKTSDINVQRVKVDLGNSTSFYTKIFRKIYLKDGSNIIAEADLNSNTVVKDGSTYFISLTGFNFIVPKNTTKVLTLSVDSYSSFSSSYDGSTTYGLAIPSNGVRGVDGAGLTQEGPSSAISRRTVTLDADTLVDTATLKVSKNSSSPAAVTIIASEGSGDNEKDKVTALVFDIKATKDEITITSLKATTTGTGSGTASATVAYLFEGDSTEPVGSASVSYDGNTGVAFFDDLDIVIPADTTKTLTLKLDIRGASATGKAYVTVVHSENMVAENSEGTDIDPTGSATGESLTFKNAGASISLIGSPATTVNTVSDNGISTSTVSTRFVVRVKAEGADVLLGREASSSPVFASSTTYFKVYNGDTATAIVPTVQFTIPESAVTISGQTATLSDGNYVDVPVDVSFVSRTAAGVSQITSGTSYSFGLEGVRYFAESAYVTDASMAGKAAWRSTGATVQ